ncbi:unnamed protein product [Spirodela intermedia]|uniref:Pre-nudix hydrolase domain-containing protein n=1 Tax=Spirodela intermedia TaxID=51605 RepID=A0A7I8JPF7_SPIIN|nr:unnamed protein product [Spirodela intermedia]CAA6671641.1 unnamed protein product [Spirodela intermedia]
MALTTGPLMGFYNYRLSPGPVNGRISTFTREDRGSISTILKGRSTSFSLVYRNLLVNGNKFPKKGVNVVSPTTSFNTTQEILDAYEDEYGGAIIDHEGLPSSANAFSAALQSSLSLWKSKGKRGIWLKLPEKRADLVPVAIKEGFNYHHAEPGYVMLTCWIPGGACMLPATASHQVGVGAFVMNENREVLVVKEKLCPRRCSGLWNYQQAEEIYSGAILIDTVFLEVVAFRHAHLVAFEKSDLFFMCVLRPISSEIKIDEKEIQAARWMPFGEFISQSFYQEDSMLKKAIDVSLARCENYYHGFTAHRVISKFDDRLSYLYYRD